jgi:hypothetical protein
MSCRLPSNPLYWSNATPKVQYLHRTLKDYVEQPEVWNKICATTPLFSPRASLCKAYALEIKGIDYNASDDYENNEDTLEDIQCRIPELIAGAMFICTLVDDRQLKSLIYVLDALDGILTRKFTSRGRCQVAQAPHSPPLMMSLAIRYDLYFWIEELLKRGHLASRGLSGAPFIFIAVDNDDFLELPGMSPDMDWGRQRIRHRPSLGCLEALLSHGADLCEEYEGSTAWSQIIDKFSEILHNPKVLEGCEGSPTLALSEWLGVVQIFINYGASTLFLRNKTAHMGHKFAKRYGRHYRESGELKRLCQILGVGYENLEILDNSEYGSVDDSVDEGVDACQDEGYYQRGRKRKWKG